MLKLFNKINRDVTYKGFNEEEKDSFKYYISNCIELVDCDILTFYAIYHNGRTYVEGIGKDRSEKRYFCECSFDDVKNVLQVITTITYSDNEHKNAIDTFYFDGDEVLIISESNDFGKCERTIPTYHNSLVRK